MAERNSALNPARLARPFQTERLLSASWAYTTRRIPREQPYRISRKAMTPSAGDLVLARVDLLGHHKGLQLWTGRKKNLFPGDEIVVVYGNRYASSQFEAIVPKTLGPCQLVAGGGVAAKALTWHNRIARGPTLITPIGIVLHATEDRPVNLRDYALEDLGPLSQPLPPTIAVVGTAMDAGKTTSAAFLVRGLTRAGQKVGFAKITGTGASGDTWFLKDAGADPVLDFTDAGLVSTYLVSLGEIEALLEKLVGHLAKSGVDSIVLEIADGVLQQETASLLGSETFRSVASGALFVAQDSMGAVAGSRWLQDRGIPVAGLSGVLTASPLQREEARAVTELPIFEQDDLAEASTATKIMAWVEEQGPISGGRDGGSDFAECAHEADESEGSPTATSAGGGSRPGVPSL